MTTQPLEVPAPTPDRLPICTAELESLEAAAVAAVEGWRQAREAVRNSWKTGAEVIEPLAAYHRDVRYRRRDPDPREERRLTRELFVRVEKEELALVPINPDTPAAGIRVHDPHPAAMLEHADRAKIEAVARRDRFARAHADQLEAERDRERMERVREALAGDDPSELGEALLPD